MGDQQEFRIAVIGAGPAGIYAAGALLDDDRPITVDVFDAMPAPFGLVRYGVAPDHPKIKSVAITLGQLLDSDRVRFFGNVRYGNDITADDLHRHYHAVIHASGSPNERNMRIPGEELAGSFAAADFVAWYNGQPEYDDPGYLAARDVVVVGAGNVALDVARMLVTSADALAPTDTPADVLEAWRSARATDVYLLARRGPAFAKFTTPELRELDRLDGVDLVVDPADMELDPASEAEIETNKVARRNVGVLRGWADSPPGGASRRIHFRFWTRPTEVRGAGRVEAVATERTALDPDGRLIATGETETLTAQAVFRAIGYAGKELPGLPFDERTATVPHETGRVTGTDHAGVYVAGWIKRGPTGVIGTNKSDAAETVRTVLADAPGLAVPSDPDRAAIPALLAGRGVRYLRWDQWLVLDKYELTEGARLGRARLKVCTVDEMLRIGSADNS